MKRGFFIFLVIVSLIASYQFWKKSSKAFHPALLTMDYDILTMADLDESDEIGIRSEFDGTNASYPYWQCFAKGKVKYSCDTNSQKYDSSSSVEIKIENENVSHLYLWPRITSGEVCEMKMAEIARVLVVNKYLCIKGQNFKVEKTSGKSRHLWTFLALKTLTGWTYSFEP